MFAIIHGYVSTRVQETLRQETVGCLRNCKLTNIVQQSGNYREDILLVNHVSQSLWQIDYFVEARESLRERIHLTRD